MNRPSLLARTVGSPLVALSLYVVYAVVLLDWYIDRLPWLLAAGAVWAAIQTMAAAEEVSRYRVWAVEWQAMDESIDPKPLPPPKRKRGKLSMLTIAMVLLSIPAQLGQLQDQQALFTFIACLWGLAWLYLAVRLMRSIKRGAAKRLESKAVDAGVTWLLGPATSSPSRAEALREIPEYCARLISA